MAKTDKAAAKTVAQIRKVIATWRRKGLHGEALRARADELARAIVDDMDRGAPRSEGELMLRELAAVADEEKRHRVEVVDKTDASRAWVELGRELAATDPAYLAELVKRISTALDVRLAERLLGPKRTEGEIAVTSNLRGVA